MILAEEHDAHRTSSSFLCLALDHEAYTHRPSPITSIPGLMRQEMKERIMDFCDPIGVAYPGPEYDPEGERAGRVLACLIFAAMAEDEK